MIRLLKVATVSLVFLLFVVALNAQDSPKYKVKYVKKHKDPVIEQMREENEGAQEERQAETQRIRDAQSERRKKDKEDQKTLTFDFEGVQKPASPDVFQKVYHFDPVRQYLTGTCWDFSTTSFFESEVYRLTGRKIKLSEMFTAYYEYLEEARRRNHIRNSFECWLKKKVEMQYCFALDATHP